MSHEDETNGGRPSTDDLRAEIAVTRALVATDINALQAKLSPENIKAEAKHAAVHIKDEAKEALVENLRERVEPMRHAASQFVQVVRHLVQRHPIPMAIVGLGLGYLIFRPRRA